MHMTTLLLKHLACGEKTFLWVSTQAGLKLDCITTQASWRLQLSIKKLTGLIIIKGSKKRMC